MDNDRKKSQNRCFESFRKIDQGLSEVEKLDNNLDTLKEKYLDLKIRVSSEIFGYKCTEIVPLLDLDKDTKQEMLSSVKNIKLYHESYKEQNKKIFNLSYVHSGTTYVFKLILNEGILVNGESLITITKDGENYTTYDVFKEFEHFNYNLLGSTRILDNYVYLFYRDSGVRFGMVLFIYYYLLHNTSLNTDNKLLNKENIKRLEKIFKNTFYF